MLPARRLPMLLSMAAARRVVVLLTALVLTLALAAGAGAGPRARSVTLRSLESGVLAQINDFRHAHRLARLRLSVQLDGAARQHSLQMAADGYFAHESADGSVFWRRIQRFYPSAQSRTWSVGENLVWSSPALDAHHALALWLASPEHRANLMNPRWREIGVAAVHAASAPGVYHGLAVTIITTDFGVRR
jgi:uncharacterized protein YkwD